MRVTRGQILGLSLLVLLSGAFALAIYVYFEGDTYTPANRELGGGKMGPAAATPSYSLAVAQPLTQAQTIEVRLIPQEERVIDMPERDRTCSGASCFWAFGWSVREPYPLANPVVEIIKVSSMGTVSSFAIANTGEGQAQYFGLVSAVNRSQTPIVLEVRYLLLSSR
jgi:hypothetical protein